MLVACRQRITAQMNREFDMGRKMALGGIPWINTPPGYAAPDDQLMTQ